MKRPKGIFCPVCLKGNQHPASHARPQPGLRVRYFRCPCGAKFRTKERLPPPPAPAGE